jgi:hypothetical protein
VGFDHSPAPGALSLLLADLRRDPRYAALLVRLGLAGP